MKKSTTTQTESLRPVTTFQETRMQHSENLRQNIVHAAAALLQEHGPEAVTVRRVAERMECSTKIIYNLFGKKEGLAKCLYLEGCMILSRSFEAVPEQPSLQQQLRALAHAYWDFAITQSSFYQVMFGGSFAEFKPDADSLEGTATAMKQLTQLVEEAQAQQYIREMDTIAAVQMIWAPLHGVIHLYLGGHLESQIAARALYEHTLSMIVHTLFTSVSKE
nr:TetR/AcrR family transcriptional regulator [Paenibacillus xylanexedens]